jgi:L-fuculose-phosphate aldolase
MKRNAIGFEEVGEDDTMLVDFEGNVLEGEGGRHAEWPIHTEVIAARPDIGGVCHTHAEHCVALAAAGDTLRPVSHAANLFVPPEVPRFEKTGDLIVTRELGKDVAEALGDQNALFLVNHGIVTTGRTLREAVVRAIVLERACRQQLLTHGFGRWATWSSPEESLSKRKNIYPDSHLVQVWDYLVRQLERDEAR